MRMFASLGLLAAVACSSNQPQETTTAPAVTLQAGQWEMSAVVTGVTGTGGGAPALKASTKPQLNTVCLKATDVEKPQPAMFVTEKENCTYQNQYLSGGRIVQTIACQEPGRSITASIEGSYTATTIDATVNKSSYRGAPDDYRAAIKLTGKRLGDCTEKQLAQK